MLALVLLMALRGGAPPTPRVAVGCAVDTTGGLRDTGGATELSREDGCEEMAGAVAPPGRGRLTGGGKTIATFFGFVIYFCC